jgi:predicted secreted hydrolase
VNPARRRALALLALPGSLGLPARAEAPQPVQRGRVLRFPEDHGAHPVARTEWWYATGWLGDPDGPSHGFQLTFFRSRTGLATQNPSRFAARQLLFAHAAVTQLAERHHRHDQRIARWSGDPAAATARAAQGHAALLVEGWSLQDTGSAWEARIPAQGFSLALTLGRSQPLLLQGEGGWSRKGPEPDQASHYYSEPQLSVRGGIGIAGVPQRTRAEGGRAWLDHEWSEQLLHPKAVGWDWIGINLFDGSVLTAFVLRQQDGRPLWAGGSYRAPGAAARNFGADELRFTPGRRWRSAASAALYPVQWQIDTPVGQFELRALLDEQELDGSASTGTVYWEGLSELRDAQGLRTGLGYLEMTGYAARLRL